MLQARVICVKSVYWTFSLVTIAVSWVVAKSSSEADFSITFWMFNSNISFKPSSTPLALHRCSQ
jgi:hypothetical protein